MSARAQGRSGRASSPHTTTHVSRTPTQRAAAAKNRLLVEIGASHQQCPNAGNAAARVLHGSPAAAAERLQQHMRTRVAP